MADEPPMHTQNWAKYCQENETSNKFRKPDNCIGRGTKITASAPKSFSLTVSRTILMIVHGLNRNSIAVVVLLILVYQLFVPHIWCGTVTAW